MKKITLLGAAALTFGLACGVSAQKKNVEFIGPPVKENEPPKTDKEKKPKKEAPQDNTPPVNSGPQSGQATGFGVGRPGGGPPAVTQPPLQNPPDNTLPPVGEPVGKEGAVVVAPVSGEGVKGESDKPLGPPAKDKPAVSDSQPAANAPARKKLAPARKTKRPRRVKKG
jgi:hypothetical protein